DKLLERAGRLLDRHRFVDAMLVVEIDVLDAEPLERPVDRPPDVLRLAVDLAAAVLVPDVAELRREDELVAAARDRAADEPLVVAHLVPVDVGGVEEDDPELERPVDRRDRLLLV